MNTKQQDAPAELLHSAVDLFLDRTRAVAQLVATAGSSGARAVVPEPVLAPVTRMLTSLRAIVEQVPALTDELDVLVEEVHAKRQSIQALQGELTALDHQLEILEGTLAPVQVWSHQWGRVQHALLHSLEPPAASSEPAEGGPEATRP